MRCCDRLPIIFHKPVLVVFGIRSIDLRWVHIIRPLELNLVFCDQMFNVLNGLTDVGEFFEFGPMEFEYFTSRQHVLNVHCLRFFIMRERCLKFQDELHGVVTPAGPMLSEQVQKCGPLCWVREVVVLGQCGLRAFLFVIRCLKGSMMS